VRHRLSSFIDIKSKPKDDMPDWWISSNWVPPESSDEDEDEDEGKGKGEGEKENDEVLSDIYNGDDDNNNDGNNNNNNGNNGDNSNNNGTSLV